MTRAGARALADPSAAPAVPPHPGRSGFLAELAAGALGTAVLLWQLRLVLFPPVARTFGHDFVFWYPVWQFYAEGLSLGELRLWNPLSYGGVPLYPALLQLRAFDPISFLVIVVGNLFTSDLLARYNWDVFLRAWVPAVAAYVFLRRFAEHAVTRVALMVIVLWSSFLLVLLRMPGAGQGFLWAPIVVILLHRLVWLGDGRWRNWAGLAVFLGLNWQSYFAAPHLTFAVLFVVGVALFHPERLRARLRMPHLALKAGLAALILALMLLPLLTVLPEGAEVVYLPRVLDLSRPQGDVGPIQYEPIPSPSVREVGLLMPQEFFISNGTPSTVWNFLQLVTPTGNWHREGGHGWGNPSEAFMYLGLPVYAVALLGLLAGRHPLRRAWMLMLAVCGLLMLGPLGGAQSFLAWIFPLVRMTRHTHTYTPYFQLALLFFFVLGCNRLVGGLAGRAAPADPLDGPAEPSPSRWLSRLGALLGIVFLLYLLVVETPLAFRLMTPGKAVTPPALALGLALLWWLARRQQPLSLYWIMLLGHLAAVPLLAAAAVMVGLHQPPRGGLGATLAWIAAYWALFLGLPLLIWWWASGGGWSHLRLGPRAALLLLLGLLVGDQLFYVSYTDYLWGWPRPDQVLGVSAEVTPLRFHDTRGLYPPEVERTRVFGQAVRYPELLLRRPYLLTAPRTAGPAVHPSVTDAAAGLDTARRLERWNSFYVPRRYLSLLHSEVPVSVSARIWALGEPLLRFVPGYVMVPDADFERVFRDLGPARGHCLLARAAVLPETPLGLADRALPGALADVCEAGEVPGAVVTVTGYAADGLTVEVVAPRPGFLVVSDSFHPRWTARVDGRPAALLRAGYLSKAVPVPAGKHTVALRFEPGLLLPALGLFTVLGVAALLSVIALGIWGLWSAYVRFTQRPMEAQRGESTKNVDSDLKAV